MNPYDACETAFKNGYEKGYKAGRSDLKEFLNEYILQLNEIVERIEAVVASMEEE